MLETTGRPAEAIGYYRTAAEADGDKPGLAILALGAALVRANKLPEAVEVFELATRNDPKRSDTFNELGKVQWSLGKYDDAAKSFRQAVKLKPKSAIYNYHLGVMLETTGRPADAIEYYRTAVDADGDKPGLAILALGAALVKANKLPEAAKVFERATRNDPKRSDTFNELGKVQWSLGKYDDAAKSFRQAVKLEPKSAIYNYHLGVMLETTGRPAEAIECYRRAAEADGDKPGLAILALGAALVKANKLPEAAKVFERATRNDPKGHWPSTSWARSSGPWESTMTPLNRSGKRPSWNPKARSTTTTWESCWRLRAGRPRRSNAIAGPRRPMGTSLASRSWPWATP